MVECYHFWLSLLHRFKKNETPESWHNWLLSNWGSFLVGKGPGTYSSKLFKSLLKIVAFAHIYQLTKLVSCTNTYCDITDSVNHGIKNTKTWISWERNIIFFMKQKKFLICASNDTFWEVIVCFVAKVTFKKMNFICCLKVFLFNNSLLSSYVIGY